jgi:hypothetical protein
MSEDKKYSLDEAHNYFAIEYNNRLWDLLDKKNRTEEEDNQIINYAHTSLVHWSENPKGTIVNIQRGEYMIANVYCYIGIKEQSLYYAKRCLKITEENKENMKDFDIAYAHLIMARALALSENKEEATKYYQMAVYSGNLIQNMEDKKFFDGDLKSGPWYSLNK